MGRFSYSKNFYIYVKTDSYKDLNDNLHNAAYDINGCWLDSDTSFSIYWISPSHKKKCYQDAMTCNPNWKKIQENLLPGQKASDRPELVARVIHLKKSVFCIS